MKMSKKTELLHLNLTTKIVTAYATKNPVAIADLPDLIAGVCHGLATAEEQITPRVEPAVPIKKSITKAHVTCLEDGTKYKMIKRHLKTAHQMTPEEYREKWGLRFDYPMVAPDYSAVRSKLAKKIGLGTQAKGRPRKPKKRA
jgi:predicted transcriptional regulator